jgi:hypothetical protein
LICNRNGIFYDDAMEPMAADFLTDFYSGAGGEVDECSIMLRFFGDDLEPDSITATLGVPPTGTCRKGELRSSGKPGLWHTGYWLLDCERTADTADNQIRLLLENDLPADLQIWRSLAGRFIAEMKVHLFPARWARGTILTSQTIQMLAERGLRLHLDIYSKLPPSADFSAGPNMPLK